MCINVYLSTIGSPWTPLSQFMLRHFLITHTYIITHIESSVWKKFEYGF